MPSLWGSSVRAATVPSQAALNRACQAAGHAADFLIGYGSCAAGGDGVATPGAGPNREGPPTGHRPGPDAVRPACGRTLTEADGPAVPSGRAARHVTRAVPPRNSERPRNRPNGPRL
ncbi:hypothetical protein GCM10009787_50110 [Streptomyces bangladeshensis]|uniref:Uncharacterized protein n=1 Tax=Streptomyces bangladeshensis TaxID=295352 RepID=A0ABN3BTH5_9ACTN